MSTNCAHMDWPEDTAYFGEFFRRVKAERVPLVGSLELTRCCNLRCVHCYLGPQEQVRRGAKREMTTAQVCDILDQAAAAGCMSLLITGGDPLRRRDFAAVYSHAKMAGIDVTVFTNGTLVTDRIIELFRDLPPRIVEISLYGASAATYESITGVQGSFARCLQGISRLHDAGIRLGLKTMLMTKNCHELGAIEETARRYGAHFRMDPVLNACLDGAREPLMLRVEASQAVRLELASQQRRQEWLDFHDRFPTIGPSDRVFQCGAGETQFHVDAFGNLQPCLMVTGVSYPLLSSTFADGWAQMAYLREMRVSDGNHCASCQLRVYCGYCPGLLQLENGDPERSSTYLCALGSERLNTINAIKAILPEGEER